MSNVDLYHHGIIEAHAGTGKTWTIVHDIVLPLITGTNCPRTHIRNICIVTYTEKAAEELKRRIRNGISDTIDTLKKEGAPEELISHCLDCLDCMHESPIGTIHGVSLRFLKAYPFETGIHFENGTADDAAGLEGCLRDSIREDWPGLGINPASFTPAGGTGSLQHLLTKILSLSLECCDKSVVLSDIGRKKGRTITTILDDIAFRKKIEQSVVCSIKENLEAIKTLARYRTCFDEIFAEYIESVVAGWTTIVITGEIGKISQVLGKYGRGPDTLRNKMKKVTIIGAVPDTIRANGCEAFSVVAGMPALQQWKETGNLAAEFTAALLFEAVPALCRRWNSIKEREGLLSFNDMLWKMREAVYTSSQFRRIIRSKIHFAIIDEFQDTSVMQWEIFKKLFVDDEHDGYFPRIYIVGDPKQSIYGFQNAVVESYFEACTTLRNIPGTPPPVERKINYRSSNNLVIACNTVFSGDEETGYFKGQAIRYTTANQSAALEREPRIATTSDGVISRLVKKPLQIVPVFGSVNERRRMFARVVTEVIQSTYGKTFDIPEANGYEKVPLDYHHYAVIAETHSLANTVLGVLLNAGIPATKYRMEGVFSSAMAVEWRVLLSSLENGPELQRNRRKALLTSFFASDRSADDTRENEALFDTWVTLAANREWPRLFRCIITYSRVYERLVLFGDGERRISDLRKIIDYSMEYCSQKSVTLHDITGYLAGLESGHIKTERGRSLHAKESDGKKVQVMTIHASKGLEFPICFIACGSSKQPGGSYLRWTQEDRNEEGERSYRIQVLPCDVLEAGEGNEAVENVVSTSRLQLRQERKRLHYVAMTRAKLFAFVPLQLSVQKKPGETYTQCPLPQKSPDCELTPVLQRVADEAEAGERNGVEIPVGIYDHTLFKPESAFEEEAFHKKSNYKEVCLSSPDQKTDLSAYNSIREKVDAAEKNIIGLFNALSIPARTRYTASYTYLAAKEAAETLFEQKDSGETYDYYRENADSTGNVSLFPPPGKETGNALHEILEIAVGNPDGAAWALSDSYPAFLIEETKRALHRHFTIASTDEATFSTCFLEMVKKALSRTYVLPHYSTISVALLERNDMVTEAGFFETFFPNRLRGFIDLLFRIRNDDGSYRYFIIDWKSNHLESYTPEAIEENVIDNHYDLQAMIYCNALDRWLSVIMGSSYDPKKNCGGALYVYLRGGESDEPTWFYKADPDGDRKRTRQMIDRHFRPAEERTYGE